VTTSRILHSQIGWPLEQLLNLKQTVQLEGHYRLSVLPSDKSAL
jgi:hypothetical protein